LREALRWKARKGGSRWGRGGKKATLEALFAALRPHGLCPRTWNRAPTPSAARGHALIKIKIIFIKLKDTTREKICDIEK
jgi:hypothetical protein